MFFQKLFGQSPKQSKCKGPQRRRLGIEPLESREMLSISPGEFDLIRGQYPALILEEDMGKYNVIEITAAELSESVLRAKITEAGTTTGTDLIVVRTTETDNKITLTGTELAINIPVSTRGSVTIVSLGEVPLTIDGGTLTNTISVSGTSTVAFGGVAIQGGRLNHTAGSLTLQKSSIVNASLTSSTTYFHDVTILGNATISGTSNATLTSYGDLTVNGTLTVGYRNTTLKFVGNQS
ncbi:MAG: hypothetical protein FWC43_08560, partial [Planctomycetaceae bacterium]|nr:hypothetical protein [Planctomycetaceae bacterium]